MSVSELLAINLIAAISLCLILAAAMSAPALLHPHHRRRREKSRPAISPVQPSRPPQGSPEPERVPSLG